MGGEPLDLSGREWSLLELLVQQRDKVVSNDSTPTTSTPPLGASLSGRDRRCAMLYTRMGQTARFFFALTGAHHPRHGRSITTVGHATTEDTQLRLGEASLCLPRSRANV